MGQRERNAYNFSLCPIASTTISYWLCSLLSFFVLSKAWSQRTHGDWIMGNPKWIHLEVAISNSMVCTFFGLWNGSFATWKLIALHCTHSAYLGRSCCKSLISSFSTISSLSFLLVILYSWIHLWWIMIWGPKRAPISDSGFHLLSCGFVVSEAEVHYLCTVELLLVLMLWAALHSMEII